MEAQWEQHADFVRRARQNFPRHSALKLLLTPVPGVGESWIAYAMDGLADQKVTKVLERLMRASFDDIGAAIALGHEMHLLSLYLGNRKGALLQLRLLRFMERVLIRIHRHRVALPRIWAAGAVEFIERLGSRHPRTGLVLLKKLTSLLRTRRDPTLAAELIRGVNRLRVAWKALPTRLYAEIMRDALKLGLPLQTDPHEIAVWSVMLEATEEHIVKLTAASHPVRDKLPRSR